MIDKLIATIAVVGIIACGSGDSYVPKPHAYPRIAFPEKTYKRFDLQEAPYSCEIPNYATMGMDTLSQSGMHKGWYNLSFTPFNATLHLTYYQFPNWAVFDSLVFDSRKLVNKHLQKADDILEEQVKSLNPSMKGLVFRIQGNTATNYNFYLTDSVRNFIRGALYFNGKTSQDSIAPVYQFLKKDIEHMISTFNWK